MPIDSAGYSAHVEMYLVVGNRHIELAQLGPEHCILRDAESFPTATGEIVLVVDGVVSRIPAYFSKGAVCSSRRVPYVRLSNAPAVAEGIGSS